MLGKLVKLEWKEQDKEKGEDGKYKTTDGIRFYNDYQYVGGQAHFKLANKLPFKFDGSYSKVVTYCYGLRDIGNSTFLMDNLSSKNGMPKKKEVTERLWVIISRSHDIETSGIKLSGNDKEALLEMKAGDTVTVDNMNDYTPEVYMAVQAGNELYLIKKVR